MSEARDGILRERLEFEGLVPESEWTMRARAMLWDWRCVERRAPMVSRWVGRPAYTSVDWRSAKFAAERGEEADIWRESRTISSRRSGGSCCFVVGESGREASDEQRISAFVAEVRSFFNA